MSIPSGGSIQLLPHAVSERSAGQVRLPDFETAICELVANALEAEARRVEVVVDLPAWTAAVSDDGCGMPAKDLRLLGERWATSKAPSHYGEALAALTHLAEEVVVTSRASRAFETFTVRLRKARAPALVKLVAAPRQRAGTTVTVNGFLAAQPVRRRAAAACGYAASLERLRGALHALLLPHGSIELLLHQHGSDASVLHLRQVCMPACMRNYKHDTHACTGTKRTCPATNHWACASILHTASILAQGRSLDATCQELLLPSNAAGLWSISAMSAMDGWRLRGCVGMPSADFCAVSSAGQQLLFVNGRRVVCGALAGLLQMWWSARAASVLQPGQHMSGGDNGCSRNARAAVIAALPRYVLLIECPAGECALHGSSAVPAEAPLTPFEGPLHQLLQKSLVPPWGPPPQMPDLEDATCRDDAGHDGVHAASRMAPSTACDQQHRRQQQQHQQQQACAFNGLLPVHGLHVASRTCSLLAAGSGVANEAEQQQQQLPPGSMSGSVHHSQVLMRQQLMRAGADAATEADCTAAALWQLQCHGQAAPVPASRIKSCSGHLDGHGLGSSKHVAGITAAAVVRGCSNDDDASPSPLLAHPLSPAVMLNEQSAAAPEHVDGECEQHGDMMESHSQGRPRQQRQQQWQLPWGCRTCSPLVGSVVLASALPQSTQGQASYPHETDQSPTGSGLCDYWLSSPDYLLQHRSASQQQHRSASPLQYNPASPLQYNPVSPLQCDLTSPVASCGWLPQPASLLQRSVSLSPPVGSGLPSPMPSALHCVQSLLQSPGHTAAGSMRRLTAEAAATQPWVDTTSSLEGSVVQEQQQPWEQHAAAGSASSNEAEAASTSALPPASCAKGSSAYNDAGTCTPPSRPLPPFNARLVVSAPPIPQRLRRYAVSSSLCSIRAVLYGEAAAPLQSSPPVSGDGDDAAAPAIHKSDADDAAAAPAISSCTADATLAPRRRSTCPAALELPSAQKQQLHGAPYALQQRIAATAVAAKAVTGIVPALKRNAAGKGACSAGIEASASAAVPSDAAAAAVAATQGRPLMHRAASVPAGIIADSTAGSRPAKRVRWLVADGGAGHAAAFHHKPPAPRTTAGCSSAERATAQLPLQVANPARPQHQYDHAQALTPQCGASPMLPPAPPLQLGQQQPDLEHRVSILPQEAPAAMHGMPILSLDQLQQGFGPVLAASSVTRRQLQRAQVLEQARGIISALHLQSWYHCRVCGCTKMCHHQYLQLTAYSRCCCCCHRRWTAKCWLLCVAA